jgi:hypothetical protein
MTLSLRNTLRSLSLLVLTVAFAPGCDGEEFEAHGLSVEDIDAMSAEELDELAALEDEADFDLSAPVRPGEPHPPRNPDGLTAPTTGSQGRPEAATDLWNPRYTHAHQRPGVAEDLWDPRYTHAHQRPGTVPGIVSEVHPTHAPNFEPVADLVEENDDGCDTHAEDPDYTNG